MRPWITSGQEKTFENFQDVLDHYIAKTPELSKKYLCQIRRLGRDLGDLPLSIFPRGLESYLSYWRTTPTPLRGRPLGAAGYNKVLILITAAFNSAVLHGKLEVSPITRAKFPRLKERPRDRYLTEEEKERILQTLSIEAPHLYPIFCFSMRVPSRPCELKAMRRQDLHLDKMMIWCRASKNDQGGWKPIPPEMYEYFRNLPPSCDYLFYRYQDGKFHPLGDFKRAWARARRIAGVTDFQFRDSRHISLSDLLNSGVPQKTAQQIGLWKTDMTSTYYHLDGHLAAQKTVFPEGKKTFRPEPETA